MKSLICSFDAKSGVLCSKCESKLQAGQISQDDIDASIKLTRLAERNPEISKFTLLKATTADGDLVLALRGSDINAIRANKSIAAKIEGEFGRKVWFVDAEASDRNFIESLLFPVRVLTLNFFWLPDGSKLTKVIAAGGPNTKLEGDKIVKITKAVRNIELLIEFEKK